MGGAIALSQARVRGVGVAPIAAPLPEKDFIKMDRFIRSLDPYLRIKVQGRVSGEFSRSSESSNGEREKSLFSCNYNNESPKLWDYFKRGRPSE